MDGGFWGSVRGGGWPLPLLPLPLGCSMGVEGVLRCLVWLAFVFSPQVSGREDGGEAKLKFLFEK